MFLNDTQTDSESLTARIPARSRRQAMDWSLALVSQGIDTAVDHSGETGWGLWVAPPDVERARGIIRQYRLENRGWPWRRRIRSEILFDWGSLAWVFLIVFVFWLGGRIDLESAGRMSGSAVSNGEWWRLFTAVFLHGDLVHLMANATFGLIFLGLAMGRYGTGLGLLAAYLAGVAGNVTTWLVYGNHESLGASGMVMGGLGLLAAQSFFFARKNPAALKYVASGFFAGLLLFVLLGTNPETDVLAHFGGFVAGMGLGCGLTFVPQWHRRVGVNLFAGALFTLLACGAWWLAMQGAR